MLQIANLLKKYKSQDNPFELNLELEIPNPSFVVITGESGSGKSTFAKILSGNIQMDSGKIKLDDEDITLKLETYVEFLEANEPLINNFTVYQTLYAKCNHLYDKDEVEEKIESICSSLKLTNLKNQRIIDLSGGEAQRVAVGCMMLSLKPILILDEATHSLDHNNSNIIVNILKEVKNRTIIYITHKPEEIEGMADMYLHFENGKIISKEIVNQREDHIINIPSPKNKTKMLSIVKSNFFTGIKGHIQTSLSYLLLCLLCCCFLAIGSFVTSIVNQNASESYHQVFYSGSAKPHNGICGKDIKYNVEVHSSYTHPIYSNEIENLKFKFHPIDVIENLYPAPHYEMIVDEDGNGTYSLHIAPLNKKDLLAGRLCEKEKEVVASVGETLFNVNRSYYKSLIGTKYGEYTIVGIVLSSRDSVAQTNPDYYASKADFEKYCSLNPTRKVVHFNYFIEENNHNILFIDSKEEFLNCVIDSSLPDDTIASSKIATPRKLKIAYNENFQSYVEFLDCVPSEHLLAMNEATFKKFTDENAIDCTKFYFNTFKECETFIQYLNSEGISYSMQYYKYNTQVKILCNIAAFLLILGVYFIIALMNRKTNRNRDSFYNKCGYNKKKLLLAKIFSSTILIWISILIFSGFYIGFSQLKYSNEMAYFALRWMTLKNGFILVGIALVLHLAVEMIFESIPRKKLR